MEKNIILAGVGGQGILSIAFVIDNAALDAGFHFKQAEVHGMAQRGGIVESAVLMGEATSPIVSNGEADVLVGFEPSETLRALNKCNPDTVVITNTAPLPPFTVGLGIGVYPEIDVIEQQIKNKTARLVSFDGIDLAKKAGNVMSLNIVLLGALIQSDILPLTPESIKKAIETTTKKAFVETNLEAFQLGFEAAKRT